VLTLVVGQREFYDEESSRFVRVGGEVVRLEHSLVSLSKWESKYGRPFLGPTNKTHEETLGYVESMLLDENPPEDFLSKLSDANVEVITEYINQTQSATTFREMKTVATANREIISAELIYFWMVSYSIPFECESWHLSRLFALIRVCNVKSSKPQKVNPSTAAADRKALNDARRQQLGTKG
jgi:hypothetical protein